MTVLTLACIAASLLAVQPPTPPPPLQPTAKAADLGIPYDRFEIPDTLGRTITYYISPRDPAHPLPLALFIQGSGCISMFSRMPDGRTAGGIQNLLRQEGAGKLCVMVVEKPGVNYLDKSDHPGSAEGCSDEFNRELTYDRWAAALGAALESARTLPGIDPSRILVAGHSEGAQMAPKIAADHPRITHVAILSGNGASQLFDFALIARRHEPDPAAAQRQVDEVYATLDRIRKDPDNSHAFAWGHAYPRWATFFPNSSVDQLLKTNARIYIAHGSADDSVPIESAELLRSELTRRGREATYEFIPGADHGFRTPDKQSPDGLREVLGHVVTWFLANAAPATP